MSKKRVVRKPEKRQRDIIENETRWEGVNEKDSGNRSELLLADSKQFGKKAEKKNINLFTLNLYQILTFNFNLLNKY